MPSFILRRSTSFAFLAQGPPYKYRLFATISCCHHSKFAPFFRVPLLFFRALEMQEKVWGGGGASENERGHDRKKGLSAVAKLVLGFLNVEPERLRMQNRPKDGETKNPCLYSSRERPGFVFHVGRTDCKQIGK